MEDVKRFQNGCGLKKELKMEQLNEMVQRVIGYEMVHCVKDRWYER